MQDLFSDEIQIIEVEKLWPSAMPPCDGGVALIKNRTFDAVCFLSSPSEEEIETFRKSPMRVSVFVHKNVPFVVFSYEKTSFNWEVSLCFVGASRKDVETFLEEGNAVALFLVDRKRSVVKAIRVLGIDERLERAIKQAVYNQFETNLSRENFNQIVREAYSTYTVEDFVNLGITQNFFGDKT